ncbi:MFS transporter [Prauserella marina]|uniref:Major Facilitator Superfamily protein n=1 Tax=Prauserella marina TaxID=530584 RepID=A0A222VNA2_9PSEU|nr:MFS transporter [Prauserella marina]ASR35201.1 MFS transporter [Prauserella marina]PWV85032.1 MFS transporter [Prauserella marina]SDC06381.1 Major Facilitator Superfamily protein [Prauserella marina]
MHALERSRGIAFAAALTGMFMAQLDGTITIAALPAIAADLSAGSGIVGVSTAYLLTVTVATPCYGALGDRYGRRAVFGFALAVFAAGSLACALAPGIGWLVAARAVQGLGGSGLIVTSMSALGELFDKNELVRRQGWSTAVLAASSLGGPALGGVLAADPGWRWIFLANLPLCVLAAIAGVKSLPARRGAAKGRFDVAGSLLIVVAGSALVALGGADGLARSPLWTPVLVVLTVVAGAGFVRVQRRSAHPLIAPSVFASAFLTRAVSVNAVAGVALYGTFTFVALVVASHTGGEAALTGLLLIVLMGGQLLASASFSVLARKLPDLTGWGRFGCAIGVAGLSLVAIAAGTAGAPTVLLAAGLALTGASFGVCTAAYTLLAQTAAAPALLGATSATFVFGRQAGGVAGTALFGWLALLVAGDFSAAGLTAVFAAAAVLMLAATLVSPRERPVTARERA